MLPIFIAGLVNFETTLAVDGFPIAYEPVRYPFFGIRSRTAGVGLNLATALLTLGAAPRLATIIGNDTIGDVALAEMAASGLETRWVRRDMPATCQAVIAYDPAGKRLISTDLKDIQERTYPLDAARAAATGCAAAILCNLNAVRPLLGPIKALGMPIISDVHALGDPDDSYNRDYMAAADVLFLSHERLWDRPAAAAQGLMERYAPQILVVGMGGDGALLVERDTPPVHVPAARGRPIVSTVGAGDSLLACFVAGWLAGVPPVEALRRACVFAAHKIGVAGAAEGFATAPELEALIAAGGLPAPRPWA